MFTSSKIPQSFHRGSRTFARRGFFHIGRKLLLAAARPSCR